MWLKELKVRVGVLLIAALMACCALTACGDAGSAASSSSTDSSASSQAASQSASESSAADASSSSSAATSTPIPSDSPYVGTWEMHSIDDGNEEILVEEAPADTVSSINLSLELKGDGSAVYRSFGGELPGAWEPMEGDKLRIEFDNVGDFETLPIYEVICEDDMLVIKDGDITMKLKRAA